MEKKKIMHYFPKLHMYLVLFNRELFTCTIFAEFRDLGRKFVFLYENHNNKICPMVLKS
jgi:hypothetical protein